MKDTKSILLIIIFILVLTIPFSNKAYHVDDVAFLYIADQILKDPLRPYSFVVEWGDGAKSAIYLNDTPLVSYYIALISLLFKRSEVTLHLSYMLFHIIAGLSFYFLAKRFIDKPLMASLLLISTPTFLVNSHNLMFDVPVLSLFLLAVVLFIHGVDKENHKFLFLGSIAAGLAYLTKPTAIVIVPLLAFYCFANKKPKYIAYQIIPVIFVVLFALHNYIYEEKVLLAHYGSFLIGNKPNLSLLSAYIFSNLSYIGGATIFPLFFVYPFLLKRKNLKYLAFSIAVAAAVSVLLYHLSANFISGTYTLFQLMLLTLFTACSIFFILVVFSENYDSFKTSILNLLNTRENQRRRESSILWLSETISKMCNIFGISKNQRFLIKSRQFSGPRNFEKISRENKIRFNADNLFIFIWFFGMYILNSIVVGGAVRYNTLFLPPLILSYFLMLKKYQKKLINKNSSFMFLILFLTLLMGILVAYEDYDYANSYKNFADNFPKKYMELNDTIYFNGGAGFQYYMSEKGFRMLLQNDNSPKKGDIIVKSRISTPRKMTPKLINRTELVATVSYNGRIPVRTQNPEAHAGFYIYAGGFLPYSISNSKLENFDIYYVKQ